MNRENYNDVDVQISVRLPGKTDYERRGFRISGPAARALATLPRDREIDWMAGRCANEMREVRQRLAERIAAQFTSDLLKLFAMADTINGYTPKEWEEMNRPGDGEFRRPNIVDECLSMSAPDQDAMRNILTKLSQREERESRTKNRPHEQD